MLDYDSEAAHYDATRGGEVRARAAAEAVERLLPGSAAVIADVACGTGIVTALLRRPGRRVVGVDSSPGMARVAASRLEGSVVIGDATRLPLPGSCVDAVTMVWLLHLLDRATAAAVLAEAARLLRPGGMLITTVDKNDAVYAAQGDAAALLRPLREARGPAEADACSWVSEVAAGLGLVAAGRTSFAGLGQGRSPRVWRERLASPHNGWTGGAHPAEVEELDALLAALPEQDRPRPDPVYPLIALASTHRKPVRAGEAIAP
ncbi:class I SAM-dependent methyltransferase [Nonomuraea roseola]|uniref:Class I SAM-dependent methyltransferase n=1 Tax=Nonomuraea roseola TaxID=46179 RepID=A0ABV5PT02_9ACTN